MEDKYRIIIYAVVFAVFLFNQWMKRRRQQNSEEGNPDSGAPKDRTVLERILEEIQKRQAENNPPTASSKAPAKPVSASHRKEAPVAPDRANREQRIKSELRRKRDAIKEHDNEIRHLMEQEGRDHKKKVKPNRTVRFETDSTIESNIADSHEDEEFDLRKAVIYSEILKPPYL